jgi:pyrimidine-nucleoside phosphorylase
MNFARLIQIKRDGQPLTADQIGAVVRGFVDGQLPDYQMAALAMAIFFRGMEPDETAALTRAMLGSGTTLQWPADAPERVDKHSTGGVGDKVSLVLVPMLASCGLLVPMISGRGLGATGGTLDKLAAIPGFRSDLDTGQIRAITQQVGCVISGATADLVPADRRLYALRDVTATIDSIPLITASILSKKLAEGLGALVLDVKFGSGAFMKTRQSARQLAASLVATGAALGLPTRALLTDMNQPLGRMVGNAVEVDEAVTALAGDGPADLMELVLGLGSELLLMAGRAGDQASAAAWLRQQIASGQALERFRAMVSAQGGNLDAARAVAPEWLLRSRAAGLVTAIDGERLGLAVVEMGGGRKRQDDQIDPSVGLEMLVRLGDPVQCQQPLIRVFAQPISRQRVELLLTDAVTVGDECHPTTTRIVERITDQA